MEIVITATKFNPWPEYPWPVYVGKEKLWTMSPTFLVPKASPLNARIFYEKCIMQNITMFPFQKDFNRAIASWISSGIHQKMENDFVTSRAYRKHFQFWAPPKLLTTDSLTMGHALPAFIILGLGLLPATITFMAELLVNLCNKKAVTKPDNKIKEAWMP